MPSPRLQHFCHEPPVYRTVGVDIRCGVLLLLLTLSIAAQVRDLPVKAMFLEAAIRFISWPVDSNGTGTDAHRQTFSIGIVGNDRFTAYLTDAFTRKSPRGVPVRFLNVDAPHGLDSCDLVYIPGNRAAILDKIMAAIRGKPVLTVTDFPDLVAHGVIIAITTENQRIRCYINTTAAEEARLSISHHLLQKSTIVAPGKHRP